MKKSVYFFEILTLIFISAINVFAQSFSISEIDPKSFPKISTSFVALDASGNSYSNILPTDFKIVEDGKDLSATAFVHCQDTTIDPAVSVELVIDQSNSMNSPSDAPISKWVKEGAISFLNTLKFVPGTQVEIITFSQTSRILCRFTSNKDSLINAINGLAFAGGTNYNPPFLDEDNGAIKRLKNNTPSNIRRIVVFLTDGDPDANTPTQATEIIQQALTSNVQVYSITVKMPMNSDLRIISAQTGGKSYAVYTKQELNNIYNMVAIDIQTKKLCTLEWIAPYGCTDMDKYRDVTVTFKKTSKEVTSTYTAPDYSVTKINTNASIQYFGDPDIGVSQEKTIEITAQGSDYNATGYSITPNTYFTVSDWDAVGALGPPPFTIKKGETRKIKIKFTQAGAKAYRKAAFILEGSPCPPEITLVGGVSQVQIINPNGGQIFSTCDEIDIKWAGVTETTPVSLYYRLAETSPWNLIASNVTGLSYKWKPNFSSNQIRVRAVVSPKSEYMWLNSDGGTLNDDAAGIALHPDNKFFYVAGSFDTDATFGTFNLKSKKLKDGYIVKYGDDGVAAWAKRYGSSENDATNSLCTDDVGNVYFVGNCYQGADFASISPVMDYAGKQYAFIAKADENGNIIAVKVLGATAVYNTFTANATKVIYSGGVLKVQGTYTNNITIGAFTLPKSSNGKFQAEYSTDLGMQDLKTGWYDASNTTPKTVTDDQGNRFGVGTFSGTYTLGSLSCNSAGSNDIYTYKYDGTPGSNDMSDTTFKIQKVSLVFTSTGVDLGACRVNQSTSKVFTGIIKNNGELPAVITKTTLSNTVEFFLNSNLNGVLVQPGESIPVEIGFSPQNVANIFSTLTIEGTCMDPISLSITGFGICVSSAMDSVYLGQVRLTKDKDSTVTCIFTNPNPFDIEINPTLDDETNFKINDPAGIKNVAAGACYNISLKFKPTIEGLQSAIINYNLSPNCDNITTKITGIGVNADIGLVPIDWKLRRKLTVNDSVLKITNNSDYAAKIEQIYFENPVQANADRFTMSVPDLSNDLAAGATLEVPVSFIPQDENAHTANVFVKIVGRENPSMTTLSGEGYLPKLTFGWECPPPIKPNQTADGTLIINSTDTKSGLYLHELKFANNTGEYEFPGGNPPKDITFAIGETKSFPITFKPSSPGAKPEQIIIVTDAAAGPDLLPKSSSTQDINCEAIGLTYTNSVDFKANLICSELSLPITITNSSAETDLILNSYEFVGTDKDAFTFEFTPNSTIEAKNNKSFNITFAPTEQRAYSVQLVIKTSYNEDITIPITGSGERIYYYTDNNNINAEPGKEVDFNVFVNVPDIYSPTIDKLEFEVKHHTSMLAYKPNSLTSSLSNWTWDAPEITNDIIKFVGHGTLNVPYKNQIMSFKFMAYLPDTIASTIYLKPIMDECPTTDSLAANAKMVNVCIDENRIIKFSGSNTEVKQLTPNPAGEKATLVLTMGINAKAEINLYNSFGEKVEELVNTTLKSGDNKFEFDLSKFGSGVYFIEISAGPFKTSKKLIINK